MFHERERERDAIHLCSLWGHLQAGVGCREAVEGSLVTSVGCHL